jgi:hypothetical protein
MSQRIDHPECKRLAANLGLLAYAAVFCLSVPSDGLAFERRAPAAGRLAAVAPHFGRNAGPAAHRPFPGGTGFTGIPPRGETARLAPTAEIFGASLCSMKFQYPKLWDRKVRDRWSQGVLWCSRNADASAAAPTDPTQLLFS